jgi:hypothetical protein
VQQFGHGSYHRLTQIQPHEFSNGGECKSAVAIKWGQAGRQRIEALLPIYLAAPAFELNLIALYYLKILGRSVAELRELAAAHCQHGCEPVRNALEAAAQIAETQMPPVVFTDEPDAIPEPNS